MDEFKGIGYKNSFSTCALLTGSIFCLILTTFTLILKPNNFILFAIIFFLLAIVFFISFIIEKKRPDIVVFLTNNSVKIFKRFTWEIISFADIDYVDYKLDVYRKTQAIFFGAGDLIIETNAQKFVVRNIKNIRNCYEKITEELKKYRNTVNGEKSE